MAKVIKQFKDGDDKFKLYKIGSTYKGKREKYLISLGYCEQEKKTKQAPETKKGAISKK